MLLIVKIEGLGYREVIWALYSYSKVVATRSMFLLGVSPAASFQYLEALIPSYLSLYPPQQLIKWLIT